MLELAGFCLACGVASWHPAAASGLPTRAVPRPAPAAGAAGDMGRRKKKGASVSTPNWDEREDISPFKLAEKRLKRYKGKATDFSRVLDLASEPLGTAQDRQAASDGQAAGPCGHAEDGSSSCEGARRAARVVNVPGRDGLFILPGFLTEEEQLALAARCLTGKTTGGGEEGAVGSERQHTLARAQAGTQAAEKERVSRIAYSEAHTRSPPCSRRSCMPSCRLSLATAPNQSDAAARRNRAPVGDTPRSV